MTAWELWEGRTMNRRSKRIAATAGLALMIAGLTACGGSPSVSNAEEVINLMSKAGMCAGGASASSTTVPIIGEISSGNCGDLEVVVFSGETTWADFFTPETCANVDESNIEDVAVITDRISISPDGGGNFTTPSAEEVAKLIPGAEVVTARELTRKYCT